MFIRLVGNILRVYLRGGGGVFTPNVGRYCDKMKNGGLRIELGEVECENVSL